MKTTTHFTPELNSPEEHYLRQKRLDKFIEKWGRQMDPAYWGGVLKCPERQSEENGS